ncbi:MAG TPA: hypothetical protein DD667_05420 [Gammaproteobacteria bacterium]|nr:hypothetical protein [Pseudomonadales bacterium]HBO92698.1 hypothetical protein [Gammaproteobacteria bacterium]
MKILTFIIMTTKTVKLSPILSTFWAGTLGVLAAKRKDRILTLSATAPDQLRRLQHPKSKRRVLEGWLFPPNIDRILARSRRNKIHFPILPSTLCQTLVFTPVFKPSPTKGTSDQGPIQQTAARFEV